MDTLSTISDITFESNYCSIFGNYSSPMLKKSCKYNNMKNYSTANKNTLVSLLNNYYELMSSSLNNKSMDNLKSECKTMGIKGYSGMKKNELINIIIDKHIKASFDTIDNLSISESSISVNSSVSNSESTSSPIITENEQVVSSNKKPKQPKKAKKKDVPDLVNTEPNTLTNVTNDTTTLDSSISTKIPKAKKAKKKDIQSPINTNDECTVPVLNLDDNSVSTKIPKAKKAKKAKKIKEDTVSNEQTLNTNNEQTLNTNNEQTLNTNNEQIVPKPKKVSKPKKVQISDLEKNVLDMENTLNSLKSELTEQKTKKKIIIPKSVKSDIWNTYIGSNIVEHRCICCKKTTIRNTNFHCGHVLSEANGGTLEISNLRPICATCNTSMGTSNMIDYVKTYGYYI